MMWFFRQFDKGIFHKTAIFCIYESHNRFLKMAKYVDEDVKMSEDEMEFCIV